VDLIFEQLNPRGCKTYLLASAKTREAWLIDPVLDYIDDYVQLLEARKLTLSFVIDTHTHADHISGAPKLTDLTDCAYVMHASAQPKQVTDRITDHTQLYLDGELVHVLHTPGHTLDSVCLILPDKILTGDTLFLDEGGAGRDDLPGGDPALHWESLRRLSELHDNVVVYPGHDYRNRRPSTIREQKERNPFLQPTSQKEYVRFINEMKLGPSDWMREVLKANVTCTREKGGLHIPPEVNACEAQATLPAGAARVEPACVSAQELRALLEDSNKATSLVLLDVRENVELTGELGHLPGIKHIPLGNLAERMLELKPLAEKDIVVICKMGGRARTAAKLLLTEGFPSIRVLTGGMNAWNECGFSVQRAPAGSLIDPAAKL